MSLISELEQLRATLQSCRQLITTLIKRWNNGEIDSSSDNDSELPEIPSPSLAYGAPINVDDDATPDDIPLLIISGSDQPD